MLAIPIATPGNQQDMLIVILDDTQIARMAKSDPAQLFLKQFPKKLVSPSILICHEPMNEGLMALVTAGDIPKLLEHLQRGFRFRPDLGDHDNGPEKITPEKKE